MKKKAKTKRLVKKAPARRLAPFDASELKCPCCLRKITQHEFQNNRGYCTECAFEAWGES